MNRSNGKTLPRIDVAGIRREQIVEAAASIIATQGIQNLSLSAIEAETGMSRGQLTYYFAAKEDILLAVFDRTVRKMRERTGGAENAPCQGECSDEVWGLIQRLLSMVLTGPAPTDFTSLQFTFLSQMGHRNDFRQRLAALYDQWRTHMSEGLAKLKPRPAADLRTVASFVQALIHGLVIQLEADPNAFDRTAMAELCLEILGQFLLGPPSRKREPGRTAREGNHHA